MAISPTAIERGFSIYMIAWRGLGHLKQVSLNKLIPLFLGDANHYAHKAQVGTHDYFLATRMGE